MKRIYIMRHSKAGQTSKNLRSDHDRPLTKKGEELCPLVAKYFQKNYSDNLPAKIITSTAVRAKQTAQLIAKAFSPELDIKTEQDLYLSTPAQIFKIIKGLPKSANNILLIGHAPGLHDFAINFAGAGDKVKFRPLRANFPPGSFAAFDIEVDSWSKISQNSGILLDFVDAKKFKKEK